MAFTQWQNYILPLSIAAYFLWRYLQRKKMQKLIPELLKKGATIIDVRSHEEFVGGANEKSINIPLDQLEKKSKDLDPNSPIILCCASGGRSAMALLVLKKKGFKELYNAGAWVNTL